MCLFSQNSIMLRYIWVKLCKKCPFLKILDTALKFQIIPCYLKCLRITDNFIIFFVPSLIMPYVNKRERERERVSKNSVWVKLMNFSCRAHLLHVHNYPAEHQVFMGFGTKAQTYPKGFRSQCTGFGIQTQCPKKLLSLVYFKQYRQ